MFVLTVKVKDSDRKYSREFPIYDDAHVSQDDPLINQCILQTIKDFGSLPDDIKFIIKCEVIYGQSHQENETETRQEHEFSTQD